VWFIFVPGRMIVAKIAMPGIEFHGPPPAGARDPGAVGIPNSGGSVMLGGIA
jgi:hypothetical protein